MHRNERFSKEYHEKIRSLVEVIMPYLMNKYKEMPVETHELNKSLAQFLKVNKCNINKQKIDINHFFVFLKVQIDSFSFKYRTNSICQVTMNSVYY